MQAILLVLSALLAAASAQFFASFPSVAIQPPPPQQARFRPSPNGFSAEPKAPRVLTHPSVERNANDEEKLPEELRRSNQFYGNPKTAELLAKDSWFTPGEMQVFNREAEKIPREQVFKIFKHAGFIRRR